MADVTVKHTPSGGPADPSALVDGPTYDNDPHIVTGLENVDNTSDADKPISTATQAALDAKISASLLTTRGDIIYRNATVPARLAKGAANTVLTMGANDPAWSTLSALLDAAVGSTRGMLLLRGTSSWGALAIGTATYVLTSDGTDAAWSAPSGASTSPLTCGGRLTLTSGTPITESDVVGAATIYYAPLLHDYVEVYSGSAWDKYQITELSLALDSDSLHSGYHQSGKNFFLGIINDSGTRRLASSVAWSSDTATGTGAGTCEVEMYEGRMVNKVTMTVRFGSASGNTVSVPARRFTIVGGFRASANGQTEDSLKKRYVSNLQNATLRPMYAADALTNYAYTTATLRQAGADSANQLDYFHCVSGRQVNAMANVTFIQSGSGGTPVMAIGVDSTSVSSGFKPNITGTLSALMVGTPQYRGFPGIGRHYLARLEQGSGGAGTTTWYSNSGVSSNINGETLN